MFCPEFISDENLTNTFTVEVKYDTFPRVANMAIEFESRGKTSGIETTKADYYAYVFAAKKELWLIKTEKLKEILPLRNKIGVGGDKGSMTKMYLLDREVIKHYFHIHNY